MTLIKNGIIVEDDYEEDDEYEEKGNIKVYANTYDPTGKDITLGQIATDKEWEVIEGLLSSLQEKVGERLYSRIINLSEDIELFGFDTYVGVLHREFFHRKSLVCDLVEPFRPIIDSSLIKALNLGQIHEDDFYVDQMLSLI